MNTAAITELAKAEMGDVVKQVLDRIFDIIKAPFLQPEMLWIIVPVVASMLFMAYYFGKYKKEELGWNTAFGNTIVLLFACVDLFRHLYGNGLLGFNVQTMLVTAVLLEGLVLMLLNFLHALPKAFAFGISSGVTVNIIVLSLIILIYSGLPLNPITALAIVAIAVVLVIIMRLIQLLQWGEEEEEEE